ncbi:MAG: response regulator transcription factor [Bacilli bacterium]|jgi:DNA-binding NarL/FixJ family response regulator|nr:response regulator transcription factor [Bacilli bacterium]
MDQGKTKIVIIEDQKILLDSFADSLRDDFSIVGLFQETSGLMDFLNQNHVDIILSDTCLKEENMLNLLPLLKARFPQIKVILMSGYPEISFVQKAKEQGADAFVYKNISLEETKEIIRSVSQGKHCFPLKEENDGSSLLLSLSKMELSILRLVCEGYGRKEIAEKLSYSENTIKSYVRSILNKTGFDSISKLAIYAVSHGYVIPEEDKDHPKRS